LEILYNLKYKFLKLSYSDIKSKIFILINIFILLFINNISKADSNVVKTKDIKQINTDYLNSRNELEEYIIDTGDILLISFFPAKELNNVFKVNQEGEIILPSLEETFVRGLTVSELKNLLEIRYLEYLNTPEIKVRIVGFKAIKVLVEGEVRNPGIYEFSEYQSNTLLSFLKEREKLKQLEKENATRNDKVRQEYINQITYSRNEINPESINNKQNNISNQSINVNNYNTITSALRKANGITKRSDLSRVKLIRNIPLGKGGGKKRALFDIRSTLTKGSSSEDIRIFDGDRIIVPKLSEKIDDQLTKSIISGLSPKFINVSVYGRVENPGTYRLPLNSSLSDVINLSGPRRALSGKIFIISYEKDGSMAKKNISYSRNARPGSRNNPYIKDGDLVSVKNSFLGKSTAIIREITSPIPGIYSTKQLIEDFR